MDTNIPIEVLDKIPQWEQIARIAPVSFIVLGVAFCGFLAAWWLLKSHISDLKEIITWLREKK